MINNFQMQSVQNPRQETTGQTTGPNHSGYENDTTLPEMPKAVFTQFKTASDKELLVKSFSLDADNNLLKGPPGKLVKGSATRWEVNLAKLQEGLGKMRKNSCICLGSHEKEEVKIGYKGSALRRTKKNFTYKEGQAAFLYFDIDGVEQSPHDVVKVLEGIVPGLSEAGKLIVYSSSAGLQTKEGTPLKESTSAHIYIVIKNGADAERFLKVVFDKLWIAGHGFYLISKAPSLLRRGLIDVSVWGSERLIYEGAPKLGKGIVQERPDSELIPGGAVDTSLTKGLTEKEQGMLTTVLQQEQEKIQPELKQAEVSKASSIAKKRDILQQEAEQIVSQHQEGILEDALLLYFDDMEKPVTVAEVLQNGSDYDNKKLADPMDCEYDGSSRTKAKFYWNDGERPLINSFAHGSFIYKFARYNDGAEETGDQVIDGMLERFIYMQIGNHIVDLDAPPQHALLKKDEFTHSFKYLGYKSAIGKGKPVLYVNSIFMEPSMIKVRGERFFPGKTTIFDSEGVKWFNSYYPPTFEETTARDKIKPILKHLEFIFPDCQLDRFVNWMAWTVHEPGTRIQFTPLLISKFQGTGRGFIVKLMTEMVGSWNSTETTIEALAGQSNEGQFSSYFKNSVMCVLHEVIVTGSKAFAVDSALRSKLTDNKQPVNFKYGASATIPVFANFLMMSNERDALKLSVDDRRIDVFEHFSKSKMHDNPDSDYYIILNALLEDANAMAQFFYYLKDWYIENKTNFSPNSPAYLSDAKKRMIGLVKNDNEHIFDKAVEMCPSEVVTVKVIKEHMKSYMHDPEGLGMKIADTEEFVLEKNKHIIKLTNDKFTQLLGGKRIRVLNHEAARVYAVANEAKWLQASIEDIQAELREHGDIDVGANAPF